MSLQDVYIGAMLMLDDTKAGYTKEGTNEQGFPIFKCKDRSHSLEVIIIDFGQPKVNNNENI